MNKKKRGSKRTRITTGWIGLMICFLLLAGQSFAQGKFNVNPKTAGEAIDSLVWANRILAVEGIFDYAGHVSIRNPENPKTFFIARSAAPEIVTKADILEVDMEGNVVTKTTMTPYAERIIHARMLNARPDMNAVIHSHPIPLVVFSVSDVPLKPVAHSAAGFIDSTGVPVYDEYDFKSPGNTGMLVTTKEEGDRLARRLGKGRAVLMRGHGFTAVGKNIPDLILTSIGLRNNALVQLGALQLGGKVKYMSSEESGVGRVSAGGTLAMERAWNAYVERVKKEMPDMR
ncbi:MAG TPA: class II aldolase/adducin family protein [Thermodesulfobacteriota bacterium]|nr:class II aldolase/adducin family protein [Thermodesulfobacteriota bacterium]